MNGILPVLRKTEDLWDVAGELDRFFDSPMDMLPRMTTREGLWHPAMDVYDLPSEVVAEIELPGIRMEDLSLRVEAGHLILEGTRKRTAQYKDEERLYEERTVGRFHRVIHLPSDVDAEHAEARLVDGVMTIRLPKIKREEGRKIEIKAS